MRRKVAAFLFTLVTLVVGGGFCVVAVKLAMKQLAQPQPSSAIVITRPATSGQAAPSVLVSPARPSAPSPTPVAPATTATSIPAVHAVPTVPRVRAAPAVRAVPTVPRVRAVPAIPALNPQIVTSSVPVAQAAVNRCEIAEQPNVTVATLNGDVACGFGYWNSVPVGWEFKSSGRLYRVVKRVHLAVAGGAVSSTAFGGDLDLHSCYPDGAGSALTWAVRVSSSPGRP